MRLWISAVGASGKRALSLKTFLQHHVIGECAILCSRRGKVSYIRHNIAQGVRRLPVRCACVSANQ